MAILEASKLMKFFGVNEVLRDISFSLKEGETLAIIGASGSGKTTLLRGLNFLEHFEAGTISIRGDVIYDAMRDKNLSEKELRKKRLHFGLVFQSFNLFPQYTALQNVTLARVLALKEQPDDGKNKRIRLEEIKNEGIELLKQMGLLTKRDSYPYQLSGGQQQRVAIARALALKPDVLCFDEPTSALDPELTGEVLRVIRSLVEKGTTMIIVTHEILFAREIADTVLFMDDGIVAEYGPPEELLVNPSGERMRKFLERYGEK
ncbi:MAG: amino acid ABC transporter ATP-binding protein [Defluviitaleaceae bacterium]|nr:amino acid ABC transporter ATP-binding protein [Defluviitaleaceae bacterium]